MSGCISLRKEYWAILSGNKFCHHIVDLYAHLQIVDDVLDFNTSPDLAGKPTFVDMRLGLATAPVLLAAQEVCWPHQMP